MRCRECGLFNLDGETRCSCGYDFTQEPNEEIDYFAPLAETAPDELNGSSDRLCSNCFRRPVLRGYQLALCSSCREAITAFEIPIWVKVAAVALTSVVALALIRTPGSLGAGLTFARGQQAEYQRDYGTAVTEYRRVAESFPNSITVQGRLGIACFKGGEYQEAAVAFEKIAERRAPRSLVREIDTVMQRSALAANHR
jgi:hypothetical protein